jgi:hypothetical protein
MPLDRNVHSDVKKDSIQRTAFVEQIKRGSVGRARIDGLPLLRSGPLPCRMRMPLQKEPPFERMSRILRVCHNARPRCAALDPVTGGRERDVLNAATYSAVALIAEFRAISLRNVGASGRTRSVTAPVHFVVQVLQLLFEVLSVGLPCYAVDTRRGIPFERKVALLPEIDCDAAAQ